MSARGARETQAGRQAGRATYFSSVVTLSAWALGCGVLALPKIFALCGVVWSLIFLLIFAYAADASLRWIVASGRYSGCCSFRSNATFFLGPSGGRLVHYGQVALLFGGIVSVLVLTASLLPCLARDILEAVCASDGGVVVELGPGLPARVFTGVCRARPAQCMPREPLLVVVTLMVFPLACQESLHSLSGISGFSLGSLAFFSLVLLARLAESMTAAPEDTVVRSVVPVAQGSFWQGPPILLMSFVCHTSILQLDAELRPESKRQVGAVIRTVIQGVALPLYAFVGLGGFAIFGSSVSSNILLDFEGDLFMTAARFALGILNMSKIPLGVVTLREDIMRSLPWLPSGPAGRIALTAALLGVAAAAAATTASLSSVLSLLGCTVGVLFSLCLPAALYWRLLGRLAPWLAKSGASGLQQPLLGGLGQRELGSLVGVVSPPRSRRAWLFQRAACAGVFIGGAVMGLLGFVSWLVGGAA